MHRSITLLLSMLARLSGGFAGTVSLWVLAAALAAAAALRRRGIVLLLILAALIAALWLPCVHASRIDVPAAPPDELRRLSHELAEALAESGRSVAHPQAALHIARDAMNAPAAPKAAACPKLMRIARIAGIFVPITGEAIVDTTRPQPALPFIAAHELAHMLGIGDETAANVAAYNACIAHGGAAAYSARLWALKYTMARLGEDGAFSLLPPDIAVDLRRIPYDRSQPARYARLADWLCAQKNSAE